MEQNNVNDSYHTSLMNELVEGRNLTMKLQQLIFGNGPNSSNQELRIMAHNILTKFEKSLHILQYGSIINQASSQFHKDVTGKVFSPNSSDKSPKSQDLSEHKDSSRKRRNAPRVTYKVQGSTSSGLEGPIEDGYNWRKYGQKDILGANNPRAYYRCPFRKTNGCLAMKTTLRRDDDPGFFYVTYVGEHTCSQSLPPFLNPTPEFQPDYFNPYQQPQDNKTAIASETSFDEQDTWDVTSPSSDAFPPVSESDILYPYSTDSELMQIPHDLETGFYKSIEEKKKTGPSDRNAAKSEPISRSLNSRIHTPLSPNTDIHLHDEAINAMKQEQMSQDLEDELQLSQQSLSLPGQISGEKDVLATSSAQIDSSVHNEIVDKFLYQATMSEIEEIFSPSEVGVTRPIQCTLVKILAAFKDHKRILLYGKGGSGKTIVLKNLFHHPATKKLFDKVLFLTVPKLNYPKFVRDEFVRLLSLNLESKSTIEDTLSLIHEALRSKKFLVILDNVCEPINLHDIGIPDPSPQNSCWVVLAARFLNVCPVIDREIEMEVLSDAEAWALFCCQVGNNVAESLEINPYARAVSKECHGSPVIISAIGSALRAESNVEEWKAALRNLQFRQLSWVNERYSSKQYIRYCYDRLKAHDVKTGFLYCSLFQQDQEIDISLLVEFFISEGLVGMTTAAAYKKAHDTVEHLINASLLEANVNGTMVRMHNVIRDSALEIILSDYQVLAGLPMLDKDEIQSFRVTHWATMPSIHNFITRAGAHLKESPSMEEWEQATMVFLMDNELSTLPCKPNCFNLVALFLQRNSSLRVIPASFFDSMSNLKLLNLSQTRIKSLPDSISSLRSLQILLLRDCERLISLPPSIGLLKSLEVLDLQGTEITHLPDNVGDLTSLKQLRVSFYGTMNVCEYKKLPMKLVSDGILSRLGLRELGMFVYPGDQRWALSASSITKEINRLKLSVLYFHFPEIEDLDIFVHDSLSWTNGDITAFKFIVGPDFKRAVSLVSNDIELVYNGSQRCLRYVNGESIPNVVVEVLTRSTSFYLDHHLRISYLSEFGIRCFNGLKICLLKDCPKLIGLIGSVKYEKECFPSLEYLSINYMWNLKGIWKCHVGSGSFTRLRHLSIYSCPKLSYVLTSSMIGMLSNLEELFIEDCVSLKYVVSEDDDAPSRNEGAELRKAKEFKAPESPVLCSLKVLKLHYLPEICAIWTAQWPPLEYVSFYNLPRLRNLNMKGNDGEYIKEIAADMAWWDSLEWNDTLLSRKLHTHVTQIHIDDL